MIQSPVTREAMSRGSPPPHTHTFVVAVGSWRTDKGISPASSSPSSGRCPLDNATAALLGTRPHWPDSETLQRQGIPFEGHFQSAQGRTSTGPLCGCLCPHKDEPGKRASRETCAVGRAAAHSKSRCRDSTGRRGQLELACPSPFHIFPPPGLRADRAWLWGSKAGSLGTMGRGEHY